MQWEACDAKASFISKRLISFIDVLESFNAAGIAVIGPDVTKRGAVYAVANELVSRLTLTHK